MHALRLILEDSNRYVGCVLAIQVEGGQEGIGQLFTRDDVQRRVGYEQGYLDLNGLVANVENARKFIEEMLSYLIDQERAASTIEAEHLDTVAQYFPFTEEAVERISLQVANNQERALPA